MNSDPSELTVATVHDARSSTKDATPSSAVVSVRFPRQRTSPLSPARSNASKVAFTCRHVDLSSLRGLTTACVPRAGDLVLAEVVRRRQHPRIELTDGRKATLFPGDEILVAYGNRYASDQFESLVPEDLDPCHLVASGGVASRVRHRHNGVRPATEIRPIGLVTDSSGVVVNLSSFGIELEPPVRRPPCFAVVGSSMNAGKTRTAMQLIWALKKAGFRVGAAKITGTGSGGDYWKFVDSGADRVLDFGDAGHVSTYLVELDELLRIARGLVGELERSGAEVVVLEIADGVFQGETAALLESPEMRALVDGYFLAVTDSLSASAGADWMRRRSLPLLALCGTLTRAPLAIREASTATEVPILSLSELSCPNVASSLFSVTASVERPGA
ncbi:MAG: DUF1611 domain-containing protein [Acidobacteriota bacterium]